MHLYIYELQSFIQVGIAEGGGEGGGSETFLLLKYKYVSLEP